MTQLELPMEMPQPSIEQLMELFMKDAPDGELVKSPMYWKWMADCHAKEMSKTQGK